MPLTIERTLAVTARDPAVPVPPPEGIAAVVGGTPVTVTVPTIPGGIGPFRWELRPRVPGGPLPPGMSIDPDTGAITYAATAAYEGGILVALTDLGA